MPPLRLREQALREEARAIADQSNDSAMFLRLAETLTAFLTRCEKLCQHAHVMERQRIVRLVVKDVLIGDDTLVFDTAFRSCTVPVRRRATRRWERRGTPNFAKLPFA